MGTKSWAVRSAEAVRPAEEPDPEVPERARLRRRLQAEDPGPIRRPGQGQQGRLLRREGLYSSLLSEWRKQRDHGALAALAQKRGRPEADPRERELVRLRNAYGRAELRQTQRAAVLTAAYVAHPERFVRKPPEPPALPAAAWINRPPLRR